MGRKLRGYILSIFSLLENFSGDARKATFERVLIKEKQALVRAEKELFAGETFRWLLGE